MVLVTIFGSPRATEGLPTLTPIFLVVNPEVYTPYNTNTSGSVGIRSEIGKKPVPLPETTYTSSRSLVTNRKTFSVSAGGVWVSSISIAPEWIYPAFKSAYTEPTQIKGLDSVTYDSTVTKNLNSDWIFANNEKVLITSQEQGVVKLITRGTFRTVIGGTTEPSMPETHDMRYLDEGPVDSPTYKPKASINDVEISDVLQVLQSRGNIFDPSKKSGYQDGFGVPTAHGKTYTGTGENVETVREIGAIGVGELAGAEDGGGSTKGKSLKDNPASAMLPRSYPNYPNRDSSYDNRRGDGDGGGTIALPAPGPPDDPPVGGPIIPLPPDVPPVTGPPPSPPTISPVPVIPVTGPPPNPTIPAPEITPVTGTPPPPTTTYVPAKPEKYIATLNFSDVYAIAGQVGGIIRKNNAGNYGPEEHVYVNDRAVVNEGAEGDSHDIAAAGVHQGGTWFTGHEQDYVSIHDTLVNNGGDECDGRGGCTHKIIHTDDLVEIHFD